MYERPSTAEMLKTIK
jgi:hypothetical protein